MASGWRKRMVIGFDRAAYGSDSDVWYVPGDRPHLTDRELLLLETFAPRLIDLLGYPASPGVYLL